MANASAAHTLTEAATINMLIHCSKGPASDLIDRLYTEGKDYTQIARSLELRFGDLCPSEEAVVKVNTMARHRDESLSNFLDRMRHVAEMAKRSIENAAARQTAIDALVEANVRRVLPNSVREALEERVLARTRMGQPPFTLTELEKECTELERKRDERHQNRKSGGNVRAVQSARRRPGRVNQVHLQTPVSEYDSYPDSMTDTEEEEHVPEGAYAAPELNDPGMIALVSHVNYISSKYQARGVQPDPQKVFQKAVNRFNRNPQAPVHQAGQRGTHSGNPGGRSGGKPQARQVTAQGHPQQYQRPPAQGYPSGQQQRGPPNRVPDGRFNLRDLLAKGNCNAGECIRCGRPGHIMSHDACPLRGNPLQDRACTKCRKGLHGADVCLLVFQQQPSQINQVHADLLTDDDSDDLNGQ